MSPRPWPWQSAQYASLEEARRAERLPHALLVVGGPDSGVSELIDALAMRLLCEATPREAPEACGACTGCRLFGTGAHPDLDRVRRDAAEGERVLRIEQTREVAAFLALRPARSGWRIVVFEEAERLNESAASALLKTLEEPPPGCLLVLQTEHPGRLLPTIRSRCQRVDVAHPDAPVALAWLSERLGDADLAQRALAVARGEPLLAERLAAVDALAGRDAVLAALEAMQRTGVAETAALLAPTAEEGLGVCCELLLDLTRLAVGAPVASLQHADRADRLLALARPLDSPGLLRLLDAAQRAAGQLAHPGLRAEDAAERVALAWLATQSAARRARP